MEEPIKKRRRDSADKQSESKEEEQKDTSEKETCRIFSVSDIHTDHPSNWDLLLSWDPLLFNKDTDVLLVAGDISTDLEVVVKTLKHLKTLFNDVFFVPGSFSFVFQTE
jgi:hypothetical protein